MANSRHMVNFAVPRRFITTFKKDCKETFFPDDPFRKFRHDRPLQKFKKTVQYFIPVFEWLPAYNFRLLRYDLLAGITITTLAIPQGISYAKLADLPPIIGLYSSFVPPFIYALFGSSKNLAVGTVAACSLLLHETLGAAVSSKDDPTLYLHLIFTSTFFTGIFQTALGFSRLGILVDFLSHSTITGFMGGTAIIICLQQLKGLLGLKHFTTDTDVVSVIKAVFRYKDECKWQSVVAGLVFLCFLQTARYVRQRKPKLFWVSAISPMAVVVAGCLYAYFGKGEQHGIAIVGDLKKGLNPISIHYLNFDSRYLPVTIRAGVVTGLIAMVEGIAIGRSFAIIKNEQVDGNKEIIAFGFMNIVGSFTSCYLTTGPFSKTAVNVSSGCKSAMSNVVQGACMMLTLLFLAPVFSYTPLVALAAIITSAMLGLINYEEMYHLFQVDKFDFLICMAAFFGVSFKSMDVGLLLSVGLSLLRALLYVARPAPCKLGKLPETSLYRDAEQYPETTSLEGILVIQLGSPIYFANCTYIRERILRYIYEENDASQTEVEHLLLDLSGVSSTDMSGIETFIELGRVLKGKNIKLGIVNPRIEVLEKMTLAKFVNVIGKQAFHLSVEEAIQYCRFTLDDTRKPTAEPSFRNDDAA
ncbi:Sulfate transporter 3.1 [Hibiscus syriacus]|uniref:Sulfate transporter 3.1 n=1 Tax=Hibiscus syriacus TaxID=106335 RepID=A0A6A2Z7X9_HIBSY|nr:probable sulfate transporter 3.5 [Hibiscus syriacus]KAE8687519.1 Sulfate transporter 3.1 [Hibiscus syriacus]